MISKTEMEKLKRDALAILTENRRVEGDYQFTVPSPVSYPYQWLWDSCFHAIILSHLSIEDAKKELLSLVSKQFENGMIPHMIYWKNVGKPKPDWGKEGTSSITQPPMIAFAALKIFKKDNDIGFLKKIYPYLYHYYNYLLTDRDPRKNHLIGIINPDESGEDNSPRFDIPLGLPPRHPLEESHKKRLELIEKNRVICHFDAPFCMKNFFWVKDVPFNVIMVANLNALSHVTDTLGYKNEAFYYKGQAIEITMAMREKMQEGTIFWSTYGEDYKKIKVKTWAIFSPLFAKMLSKEEAEELVANHLRNKEEFAVKYPVPTVAINEESYSPGGFWRGPVWMATNWFIYKGLLKYGMTEDAERIRESSLSLIREHGFREQFDPMTGKPAGAEKFTWGALVFDMFEND